MREKLFKGKNKDDGKWFFGYLFDDGMVNSNRMFVGGIVIEDYKGSAEDKFDITGTNFYEVIPETVCEYTGLTDRDGHKIFEGDIVSVDGGDEKAVIVWDSNEARFAIESGSFAVNFSNYWGYEVEVIGNIFDNPEILKEGD